MRYVSTSTSRRGALGTLLYVLAGAASAVGALTPTSVLADINNRGARAVVNDIFDKPSWVTIIDYIETGQPEWLKVAVALFDGTDAGSTEMLTSAAGVALLYQPRRVLLEVAPVLGLEEICSAPDIDDARWPTQRKLVKNLDARIASVSHLSGADIVGARDLCLKSLEKERTLMLSPNGPYR